MHKAGKIEPANSSWNSPLLTVVKKDKTIRVVPNPESGSCTDDVCGRIWPFDNGYIQHFVFGTFDESYSWKIGCLMLNHFKFIEVADQHMCRCC